LQTINSNYAASGVPFPAQPCEKTWPLSLTINGGFTYNCEAVPINGASQIAKQFARRPYAKFSEIHNFVKTPKQEPHPAAPAENTMGALWARHRGTTSGFEIENRRRSGCRRRAAVPAELPEKEHDP
jgi:hypothetical protein